MNRSAWTCIDKVAIKILQGSLTQIVLGGPTILVLQISIHAVYVCQKLLKLVESRQVTAMKTVCSFLAHTV